MSASYKEHFSGPADAARYDEVEYAPHSYGRLLWELEKAALESLRAELRRTHAQIRYLDFASGTGRVAGFMEGLVDSATAIEVSESMAARARQRLAATAVLRRDITAGGAEVEGKYDLITAFRFFLNAEPGLRLAAVRALAARLQDETSWLVFNNHGNLWSLKMIGWPYHRVRSFGKARKPYGNYLRHAEVRRFSEQAGLRIVRVLGLGVLGGKVCGLLPFERALRLETRLARVPVLRRLGQDQIYVACRQPGRDSRENS